MDQTRAQRLAEVVKTQSTESLHAGHVVTHMTGDREAHDIIVAELHAREMGAMQVMEGPVRHRDGLIELN